MLGGFVECVDDGGIGQPICLDHNAPFRPSSGLFLDSLNQSWAKRAGRDKELAKHALMAEPCQKVKKVAHVGAQIRV